MLTGTKPFRGEVVTETLAAVIRGEPDWQLLPTATPRRVETLVRRCLKKSERQRLQAIGDARIELDEMLSGEAEPEIARPAAQGPRWKTWVAVSLAGIAIAVTVALVTWNLKPTSAPRRDVSRQTITLPPGQQLAELLKPILALAPDDRHLAYVATQKGEAGRQIYLWSFEQGTARPVPGSAGSDTPFFSEDGQWLGFYNGQNTLMTVPVSGGVPESLVDVVNPYGVSWIGGRRVAVASLGSVIRGLSDDGRTVQSLTQFQTGETLHGWPTFLPGNEALLFNVFSNATTIAVQRFGDEGHRTVITGGAKQMPRYSPSGHLIYAQTGNLMAVPFDLEQLNVSEGAVPTTVLSGLQHTSGNPLFTVSASGSLAYVPGAFREDDAFTLVRVSRNGTELKTFDAPARYYHQPRVSHDGRRVGVGRPRSAFPASVAIRPRARSDQPVYLPGRTRQSAPAVDTRLAADRDSVGEGRHPAALFPARRRRGMGQDDAYGPWRIRQGQLRRVSRRLVSDAETRGVARAADADQRRARMVRRGTTTRALAIPLKLTHGT